MNRQTKITFILSIVLTLAVGFTYLVLRVEDRDDHVWFTLFLVMGCAILCWGAFLLNYCEKKPLIKEKHLGESILRSLNREDGTLLRVFLDEQPLENSEAEHNRLQYHEELALKYSKTKQYYWVLTNGVPSALLHIHPKDLKITYVKKADDFVDTIVRQSVEELHKKREEEK